MAKVRLALVGCGQMGQGVHLPNLLGLEQCQVLAVADVRADVARQVAEHYRIPKVYHSHQEVAADPEIDAVAAITLWTETPRVAADLLRAGKHVFVEKPLALSAAEAAVAAQAARESGRLLMVGYPLRFDAGVQHARELLTRLQASGELGRILWAQAQLVGGGNWTADYFGHGPVIFNSAEPRPPQAPAPDFVPPHEAGKYSFFAQAYAHNLNLVRMLLGDGWQVAFADLSGPVSAVVLDNGSHQTTLHFGLNFPRPPYWDESLLVTFERGWLRVQPPPRLLPNVSARVTLCRGNEDETVVSRGPFEWAFRRELQHFLAQVESGAETLSPGADAVADAALTEAIFMAHLRTAASREGDR
jgi:predicted dehydrogenase